MPASKMRAGDFSIGDFALFATYLMQVTDMTGFLGYIVTEYQQMGIAFQRAIGLLQGASPAALVAPHPVDLQKPEPTVPTPRLNQILILLLFAYRSFERDVENLVDCFHE